MGTNETNINKLNSELNHNHKPIIITFNINFPKYSFNIYNPMTIPM